MSRSRRLVPLAALILALLAPHAVPVVRSTVASPAGVGPIFPLPARFHPPDRGTYNARAAGSREHAGTDDGWARRPRGFSPSSTTNADTARQALPAAVPTVASVFRAVLPAVARASATIPVYLPSWFPPLHGRVYPSLSARASAWEVQLADQPTCTALYCVAWSVQGSAGGQISPQWDRTVDLGANGTGYLSLNRGSNSLPSMQWTRDGNAYNAGAPVLEASPDQPTLVRIVRSMVRVSQGAPSAVALGTWASLCVLRRLDPSGQARPETITFASDHARRGLSWAQTTCGLIGRTRYAGGAHTFLSIAVNAPRVGSVVCADIHNYDGR